MNDVLKTLNGHRSIRRFNDEKISEETVKLITDATLRAPTAGNMMMYSMIVIKNKKTLEKLSKTCDHQAFIKTADTAIIFLADISKWAKYFKLNDIEYEAHIGDVIMALNDTLIASQNSVIAAESLGIGTCYIGDIMENFEKHQEILNLPKYVFPCTMVVFGHYDHTPIKRERFDEKFVVFKEKYSPLKDNEILEMFKYKEETFKRSHPNDNFAKAFYNRKINSDFFKEMNRSIEKALESWGIED
jgi:FMN reductase (NADPH)